MVYVPGPFDASHIYLQWGGKLPGNEQWSCGMRMANTSGVGFSVSGAMLTAYSNAIKAFHQAAGTGIHANAKLSFVKANLITAAGLYQDEGATNQVVHADISGGMNPATLMPNQVALAVSLLTGFSRGAAHRGRIYLPLPTQVVDANGQIAAADCTAVNTAFSTMRTALNAGSTDWKLAVFSRKAGAAAHRLVTASAVGRVLDTQRRRRRSLLELYV